MPPILELEGIGKRFAAATALDGATVRPRQGTIHALLGENGAGKTTLMRIAAGLLRPDAGVIRIRGEVVRLRSPAAALAAGIGMVHQHFTLVPAMTVAENLDEVPALSQRVLVVYGGTVREVAGDRDRVSRAMLGAA
jgi:simple sugar transport system ATP-binding protein